MTADLAMMPAHELVKLFKARKASPVEATRAAIARIDALNPQLNAFQHLDPDGALRAARASEKRWKKGGKRLSDIDGVPITIKDMVLTKGMPTRMGSAATDENGPWNVDSPVAQRLREAGRNTQGAGGSGPEGRGQFQAVAGQRPTAYLVGHGSHLDATDAPLRGAELIGGGHQLGTSNQDPDQCR